MEFVLIIGIFEAFFLAGLLFAQKEKNLSDNILGSFFLLYGINFVLENESSKNISLLRII